MKGGWPGRSSGYSPITASPRTSSLPFSPSVMTQCRVTSCVDSSTSEVSPVSARCSSTEVRENRMLYEKKKLGGVLLSGMSTAPASIFTPCVTATLVPSPQRGYRTIVRLLSSSSISFAISYLPDTKFAAYASIQLNRPSPLVELGEACNNCRSMHAAYTFPSAVSRMNSFRRVLHAAMTIFDSVVRYCCCRHMFVISSTSLSGSSRTHTRWL
mmetsp:Transcript_11696/g.19854  ORF Transcript_11696/g.19854 Transcript_11696/m.19854 type:complete len:213 (-) Transcript_11696:822-1460(-)